MAAVTFNASGLAAAIVVFVLVVPFEKLFPRHRGQRLRRPELGTDLAYALATPLLQAIGLVVAIPIAIVSLAWLPGLALRPLVGSLPGGLRTLVGLVAFDLIVYWSHRWSHEVPLLWRFHRVHHSPRTMDWVSGFRLHPFDVLIAAPPVVFLLAAGFSPEFGGVLAVIQIVLGLFLHANVRWRLRPLHRLVITPEFHHWHHANEPRAHHTNYATFLPLWDLIFGTYFVPRDRRPEVYGIDDPIASGIVGQLIEPVRSFGRPWRALRHPGRAAMAVARGARTVVRDIVRASTRPTRSTSA